MPPFFVLFPPISHADAFCRRGRYKLPARVFQRVIGLFTCKIVLNRLFSIAARANGRKFAPNNNTST